MRDETLVRLYVGQSIEEVCNRLGNIAMPACLADYGDPRLVGFLTRRLWPEGASST